MDKNYKMTFKMDTYIQGTLILMILGCGLASLFGIVNYMILGMVLLFPLGVWQVSSGLLFSILLKDKRRLTYLFSVIGFFASLWVPNLFGIKVLGAIGPYFAFSLMAILAFYYFSLTMKDMVATNTEYMRDRS